MFAVVVRFLCLFTALGLNFVVGEDNSNDLWSVQSSGDVILHAIFPLSECSSPRNSKHCIGLYVERIVWMGAMIQRISEINRARILPGSITLGYSVRDSSSDPKTGLRQTLSVMNEIINKDDIDKNGTLHLPVLIGPASDRVQSNSGKLCELLDVPRISYTATSSRFNDGKIIRTVPSDHVHIKALLLLLKDMNCEEVSVVTSKAKLWWNRANTFKLNMEIRKMHVKNVTYVDTVDDSSLLRLGSSSLVVVVFAEARVARRLIKNEKKQGLYWIAVNKFDDPLLEVFDPSGNLLKKIIIRNLKQNHFSNDKDYFRRTLEAESENLEEKNWLAKVAEKFVHQCENDIRHKLLSGQEVESQRKECSRNAFQKKIKSFFKENSDFRSTLTIQGVVHAVNLIASSLKDSLENCAELVGVASRSCLQSLDTDQWFGSLKNASLKNGAEFIRLNQHLKLAANYSIQVLRRTKGAILGKRMPIPRGWTFEEVRKWNITEDLQDILDIGDTNGLLNDSKSDHTAQIHVKNRTNREWTSSSKDKNDSCAQCNDTLTDASCKSGVIMINWNDVWAISLYILELVSLFAVILSLLYFFKHKNSPIMILCYSWPDNIVLALLCLFCLLPMMHVGELSAQRCLILWPVVNMIFAFYSALLLTKTIFVQNLLKCEVATERPGRRIAFSLLIVLLQGLVLATLLVSGSPTVLRFSCPPDRVVIACDIHENISVLGSMVFNWLLLLFLCVLAILETIKQRENFCRTENLTVVAVVGLISYTCLTGFAYHNLQLKHYLVVTLIHCVIYFVNPSICLAFIYLPTLRLVSTWLRQHTRQQRNLTSIKHAQVMSSKRQSAGPLNSLFGSSFLPEQMVFPSRQSGYYFDLRPASDISEMSYPNSLVRSVHEPTHVVFGYGRSGATSPNESAGFHSWPPMGSAQFEITNRSSVRDSVYDNVSTPNPAEIGNDPSPEELLREIATHWRGGIFFDKKSDTNVELAVEEANKWPSLEGLRASNI